MSSPSSLSTTSSPIGPPPPPPPKSPINDTFRSLSNPPNATGRVGRSGGGPVVTIPVFDSTALPPRSVSLSGHVRSPPNPMVFTNEQSTLKGKGKARAPPLQLLTQAFRPSGPSSAPALRDFHYPISPFPDFGPSVTVDASAALSTARRKMEQSDREAMRKLRSTLLDQGGAPSSSTCGSSTDAQSPDSPIRTVGTVSSEGHGTSGLANVAAARAENGYEEPQEDAEAEIDFRIAVVGHSGSGKTSFIKKALRGSGAMERSEGTVLRGIANASYVSQIQPGGKIRFSWTAEFLEVDMLRLADPSSSPTPSSSSAGGRVSKILSEVSGVILCYDAQRKETFAGIPELLAIISRQNLPAVLLACRSDPDTNPLVNPGEANAIAQPFNIGLIEVTTKTTDGQGKMKNGVRWLIFKLEQRIRREQRKALAGSSTETSLHSDPAIHRGPRITSYDSSTDGTRSTDDHILYRTDQLAIADPPEIPLFPPQIPQSSSVSRSTPTHDLPQRASLDGQENAVAAEAVDHHRNGGITDSTVSSPSHRTQSEQRASIDWAQSAPQIPPGGGGSEMYVSLENLSNRLFANIVSGENDAFVAAFFMTYRRFLTPYDLMRAFLDRFREVDQYKISKDIKFWTLSKLTGVLILWTSTYIVDLAEETTQAMFRECLALTLRYPAIAHLVQDLIDIEEKLYDVEDLDASWALRPSSSSTAPSAADDSVPITPASESLPDADMVSELNSVAPSDSAKLQNDGSTSTHSYSTSSLALEDSIAAQSGSLRSGSDSRIGAIPEQMPLPGDMGFGRWSHSFTMVVNTQPDRFAMELTRLQWEIFQRIRPRDVLRYDIGKERNTPVTSSITFFNHLSRFVSTLILANPKPRHRSRIYERFMAIVAALRKLRNYDGMCAILSGTQEVSILRMTQTMSFVTPGEGTARDWKSHMAFMDPRSGYATYRAALKADLDLGKPALPLLTALLGMVSRLNAVRAADVREDGTVQWDKFAKFGEYLSVIPDLQRRGPPVPGEVSSAFRTMWEETPVITNEDGLYERSKMLEPSFQGANGRTKLRRLKMG